MSEPLTTNSFDPADSKSRSKPLGQVICFASAKGGTGKTILSATTVYLLLKSGMRVVAIDADFSTRGLSLYLLGDVLARDSLIIQEENCLADAILNGRSPEDISPIPVIRDSLRYFVVLSNKEVRRGGVPDERFLGGLPSTKKQPASSPTNYYDYLKRLCDRFRQEYDYVVIDTRGGYDFTSAVPATIADGFVTVLEADRISLEQVGGFLKKIDEFAGSIDRLEKETVRAVHKGFIINKALHSVDDRLFPQELFRLYEATTFGAIPADRSAIRAYQVKQIPTEKSPDADFSHYSTEAITKLLAPKENWPPENANGFQRLARGIKTRWESRKRVELLQQAIPLGLLLLVALAANSYLLFKANAWRFGLPVFYGSLAAFVMASILGSMLGTLSLLRMKEASSTMLRSLAGVMFVGLIGLGYLAVFDVHKTFSRETLLQRAAENAATIAQQADELEKMRIAKSESDAHVALLTNDVQRTQSERDEAQKLSAATQQQLTALQAKQSQAEDSFKNAQAQLNNLSQQNTNLKEQVAYLQRMNSARFDPRFLNTLDSTNDELMAMLKGCSDSRCQKSVDLIFHQKNLILDIKQQVLQASTGGVPR